MASNLKNCKKSNFALTKTIDMSNVSHLYIYIISWSDCDRIFSWSLSASEDMANLLVTYSDILGNQFFFLNFFYA